MVLRYALLGAGILLVPLHVVAASCGCPVMTPKQKYDAAQVVFAGDALRYVKSDRGPQWTILRFTPVESWKGAGGASVDIEVPTKDGSCSVEVLIGHRYLVYANAQSDGTLLTTQCMGTLPLSDAVDDVAYLRSIPGAQPSSPDRAPDFSDVPADDPYAQAISDFRKQGVIQGYNDGSFRPDRPVSRAEIAQVLSEHFLPEDAIWREEGEYAFTNKGLPFTDIDPKAWYNLALRRCYRAGLIDGYHDGTFRPGQWVTVAESIKLVVSAMGIAATEDVGAWYERYVNAASDRKALPPSIRSLSEPMTRGELVEMLWRLSRHVTDRDSLSAEQLLSKTCVVPGDESLLHVDVRRVRETWLSWYNDVRRAKGLKPYEFDPHLSRSASLWSQNAAKQGFITHARDGTIGSYHYDSVKRWFSDLGLEFRNVGGITFTENIGWGPYRCSADDCTDALIQAIHTSFDFYLSEEHQSYRPHYNAIVNPSFTMMGLGIATSGGKYYLTVHFGTGYTEQPPRLCPS